MKANLFQRGAGGVPDISNAAFIADLWPRLASYEDTISATFGFESCRMTLTVNLDEALYVMDNWLGCALEVWGDDADKGWEGRLSTVDLSVAGRQRSVSLDPMENRVRVRYTTFLGTPGSSSPTSDTASTGAYGTQDGVVSIANADSADAAALAAAVLAERAYPRPVGSSAVSLTAGPADGGGGVQLGLAFAGWYDTLGRVVVERADTSKEATTTQLATLLSNVSPGVAAVNAFISTSTAQIAATGVSYTRKIESDTSYRQAIETRLGLGDTSSERYTWGVGEDRTFYVRQWAGASPSTVGYRVRFGSGQVETSAGVVVPWWAVRPDVMLEDVDLLAVGVPSGAVDSPARFYVERVTRRVDASGVTVTFEPAAATGLTARVARMS